MRRMKNSYNSQIYWTALYGEKFNSINLHMEKVLLLKLKFKREYFMK